MFNNVHHFLANTVFGAEFPVTKSKELKDQTYWRNLNAFCARLTRDGIDDCTVYALWVIREAQEDEPDPCSKAYHRQGPPLDYYIPIVADYISQIGFLLFQSEEDFGDMGKGERLWKGKTGFCMERWIFWKERLRVVRAQKQCKEETRRLAGQTERLMRKIEKLRRWQSFTLTSRRSRSVFSLLAVDAMQICLFAYWQHVPAMKSTTFTRRKGPC